MLNALILGAALVALGAVARAEGTRLALVVGNADYDALTPRPQAGRNAREIAAQLEQQQFEVSLLLNSDRATFSAAFDSFANRAADADVVLFYFAGHGLRVDGTNLIAPIDLPLDDPGTAAAKGLALAPLLDRLATGARPAVVVLDANRRIDLTPPLAARMASGLGVPATVRDAILVMATQPGGRISGETGTDFTLELGEVFALSGQPLEPALQDLAARISSTSDGRQTPWIRSSLSEPLFLHPFQPDAEDFARLAALPEARQEFLLDIWRSQGARLDPATVARNLDPTATTDSAGQAADTASIDRTGKTADTAASDPLADAPPADTAETAAAEPVDPGDGVTDGTDTPSPDEPMATADADQAAGATTTETPRFTFEYIEDDETASETAPEQSTPAAQPASRGVTVAAVAARDAQISPAVADAPIARIQASRESFVPTALDPSRTLRAAPALGRGSRLTGKDVTDLFFAPDDLPRAVQTELARLGCYRVGVDGIWGPGSRRALNAFITRSGADAGARFLVMALTSPQPLSTAALIPDNAILPANQTGQFWQFLGSDIGSVQGTVRATISAFPASP
ncbi:caspase family protein [Salibaculum halophilum]|uniref:caspase family protein n=1 Tax=Salibaculum halophilum TaxID=1914408 RepID=UPI0015C41254|nr:caspase family protein [Salibaculum halophilum]